MLNQGATVDSIARRFAIEQVFRLGWFDDPAVRCLLEDRIYEERLFLNAIAGQPALARAMTRPELFSESAVKPAGYTPLRFSRLEADSPLLISISLNDAPFEQGVLPCGITADHLGVNYLSEIAKALKEQEFPAKVQSLEVDLYEVLLTIRRHKKDQDAIHDLSGSLVKGSPDDYRLLLIRGYDRMFQDATPAERRKVCFRIGKSLLARNVRARLLAALYVHSHRDFKQSSSVDSLKGLLRTTAPTTYRFDDR